MSASLLRKGLELLEAPAAPRRAAAAAPPDKRRLKRRKKKEVPGRQREKVAVRGRGRGAKSALEEYRKHQAVDHFRENLKYMMSSQFTADHTITQKVLAQNRGRKSQDRPEEEAEKKPKGTVFTEEDFQRFEKEYFGGAGAV
ncbi:active regulator of SIRT1 [Tiliqua scincoides]|uniref:active regulator of SIRT1 n=1 Tax=Tiliqua scincoides TaxID=71010 RepID=UPI0034633696